MKALIVLALCLVLASCQESAKSPSSMSNVDDSVSYALGMSLGNSSRQDSVNLVPEMIAAGIRDTRDGTPAFSDSVMQRVMNEFQQRIMVKQQERMKHMQDSLAKAGETNKAKGEAFLAENKTKEGVVTLPSGLQYKVITEGSGPSPKAADQVQVHYHGTLIDGTVFDSSVERGEPVTFAVNGVIPGWTEALQLMKVGSKWRLFIPSDLAYGANPQPGGKIGPNDVLIFDVELLAINPASADTTH